MENLLPILDATAIDQFATRIFDAWEKDKSVLTFGNVGSAATASHCSPSVQVGQLGLID